MKLALVPLKLILALIQVESGGDWTAVGAAGERGGLQITSICVADVNRIYGTSYTPDDAFDPEKAKHICELYLGYYCSPERLGRQPTLQDMARIWNKGPNGHRDPRSLPYWRKVKGLVYPASPRPAS